MWRATYLEFKSFLSIKQQVNLLCISYNHWTFHLNEATGKLYSKAKSKLYNINALKKLN